MIDNSARGAALDPRWLPHTFSSDGSRLTSVFVPREKHSSLMFLSDDHYRDEYPKATHGVADIAMHVTEARTAPIHYIFHTAFCCSTLMVKALDIPGRTLGLKEPDVLINVANRITRGDDPANRQRLGLVLRLLARPFEEGETVIVKPTNFANRLIMPALDINPDARAVFLHSDLDTLLRSLVKRGMWGRIWGRKLYASLKPWSSLDFGYDALETFQLTDLQIVGLAWLMQIHHFNESARRLERGRVMIVDSADFTADPASVLESTSELFGLGFDRETIDGIAAGPVFSRHSKFSQLDYSFDAREADQEAAVAAHREEIDMVVKWIAAVAEHCRVPLRPSAPALT